MPRRTPAAPDPRTASPAPAEKRKRGRPRKTPPADAPDLNVNAVNMLAGEDPASPDFLPDGQFSDDLPDDLDPAQAADDAALVRQTLRAIMADAAAPAAAKAQAARTLAEINRMLGRHQAHQPGDATRDLRSLTAAELAAELAALG